MSNWDPLGERPGLDHVRVAGVDLRPGDRVRLWPLGRADILDLALEGKTATIEAIEQDFEDRIYLAVTVDDAFRRCSRAGREEDDRVVRNRGCRRGHSSRRAKHRRGVVEPDDVAEGG